MKPQVIKCIFLLLSVMIISCRNDFDASRYKIEAGDSIEHIDSNHTSVIKFFPDGNYKAEFMLFNGIPQGDIYEYYNSHDTVIISNDEEVGFPYLAKKFKLKDYFFIEGGSLVFRASLTANGNIQTFEGNPVVYHLAPEKKYQVGDTLESIVQFAAVKQFDFNALLIEFFNGDFTIIDSLELNKEFEANLTYIFDKPGNISLGIQYEVNHRGFYKKDEVVLPTIQVEN